MHLRRIGRTFGVVHQTVANWLAAHAAAPPAQPPQPDSPVATAERDELYTIVGEKHPLPLSSQEIERAARGIWGWDILGERTTELLQDRMERRPQAAQDFAADVSTNPTLVYSPGHHAVAPGQSQTHAVEADNAEVRHYLTRAAHKSRCFARSRPYAGPSSSSSTPGTTARCTSAPSRATPLTSATSYVSRFSHSRGKAIC